MFQGSIPHSLRQITSEIIDSWICEDVYVGCSGNLTVERILSTSGRFRLHSNDVTIYSSTLAAYFAGQPFRVELREEHAERFGWLRPFMTKPVDVVATMLLATRFADGVVKSSPYHNRLVEGYRRQFESLHVAMVKKILASRLRIASFYCGDVLDYVERVPREAGFALLKVGSFEQVATRLAKLFDWGAPTYEPLNEDGLKRLLAKVVDREHWMFGLPERLAEYEQHVKGVAMTLSYGVPIYLYANSGRTRVVGVHYRMEAAAIPRLGPEDEIRADSELSLRVMGIPQFNSLRALYLDPLIFPGSARLALAVLVDGKMAGCFALADMPFKIDGYLDSPTVYLLTDFPVRPTRYRHLAKLVLIALLSKEAKLLAERATNRRVRSFASTAFSANPVSMKYRGLFELLIRKETPDGHKPYKLTYGAAAGQWTLAEGLALWRKKFGEMGAEAAAA